MTQARAVANDQELKQLIEAELLNDDRVSSQAIQVAVSGGVAKLIGTIGSFRRKLAAQQIVAAYEGIRDVQNELAVEPIQHCDDDEITETVRSALDASADTTKETITVAVVGGKVTLTGTVGSHWERVVAEDIARGVRGVRDVVNMLIVDLAHKVDDHELMNSVQAALGRARGLASADIRAAIGEDTVVLSGEVTEPWQKDVAQTVVGRFGFLHIRNEIQVTG